MMQGMQGSLAPLDSWKGVRGALNPHLSACGGQVDVFLEEAWDRSLDDQGRIVFQVEVDREPVEPLVRPSKYTCW